MLQAPRSCGSKAGDSPQPSPAPCLRLLPQRKTFRRRETREKSRSVKKPRGTRSPGTKRLEQYQAPCQVWLRASTEGIDQTAPHGEPSSSHQAPQPPFPAEKKRGNIPRKPGRQHRRAAIRIRIQMRSQDVSYYNPGAPLWRLRAGPFSPLSRRRFAEMPLIKKQPHLPLAGGGWGGGIQRVGTHPTLCQPPACPCGIKPRPGSQQYSPEQPAG